MDTPPGSTSTNTKPQTPAEAHLTSGPQNADVPQPAGENPENVLRDHLSGARPDQKLKQKVNAAAAAVHEWEALQKRIQAHAAVVKKNEWRIAEGFSNYRLALSDVSFKSTQLDQELWQQDHELTQRVTFLHKATLNQPLFLHPRKKLREFEQQWEDVLNQQNLLLDQLAKAPQSVDFYNRMHLTQIKKDEQAARDAEIARRNQEAKTAIEKAMAVMGQSSDGTTLGSSILRLDDAKKFWDGRLQEITDLESNAHMDPEELITVFQSLESTISSAPAMAQEVKAVEGSFIRLINMHEELAGFGKNVIPPEELSRILILVQDEIPRLWAMGAWEKLRQALGQASNFIKFYELPVRSELSLAERRRPGLTKALLMGANSLPISQATPLIRSLVGAIDSRDRYMRGHSDTVARLAVQIAKKMNWSGDDLEMLEIAALLHDVGKIAIPENVLNKMTPLSAEEWKTIQMHPYHGAKIVKSLDTLSRIIPWIYHHQERWDGGGYPDGLIKENIPAAARIIGVSEAYTVMITDQAKRKALPVEQAAQEIQKGAGAQFDPEVAEAFSDAISASSTPAETPVENAPSNE